MARPKKPRRSVACSFSLPPELRPQLEYVQMTLGLSAWIQGLLYHMEIDEVLTEQYGVIKDIIDKNGLYVRRMGMNDTAANRFKYDFVIKGLGRRKETDIAVDVLLKKDVQGNIRSEYEKVCETLNEIKSKGFDIKLF